MIYGAALAALAELVLFLPIVGVLCWGWSKGKAPGLKSSGERHPYRELEETIKTCERCGAKWRTKR